MRRILLGLMLGVLSLLPLAPVKAADSTVAALTAAGAVSGTELFYCVQTGADRKCTATQLATFIFGQVSGDATSTGPGVFTVTKTSGVAFGTLATVTPGTGVATALAVNIGSAGAPVLFNGAGGTPSAITLTNGTGLPLGSITGFGTGVATWLATPSGANLLAALTTKTGTGLPVFGTAPTISSLTASVAATLSYITGSTQCLHVDTSGAVTGTGADCGSGGGTGANPTATAGPTAVNGVATTFLRSDGAPAIQKASASVFGIVEVDGTTITASGGVISSVSGGAGTVTSIATSCGATGGTITTTGTISASISVNPQTGTNYAIVTGDCGKLVNLSNASAQVPTIAQAGTTGFAAGYYVGVCNQGAGTQTITPATSTIGGAATFVLPAASAARPACVTIVSDGTNYQVAPDFPMDASQFSAGIVAAARGGAGTINGALKGNGSGVVTQAACADLSNGTALCSTTPGTGVATAAATALSAAGGLTSTIAGGTSAMGTSAIASAACATVVTTAATNTATTDVVLASFNGDPTAVTGYVPLVAGMLTIIAYPTANNVNFKVCNNTSSSITPGALTLNWRVLR